MSDIKMVDNKSKDDND